MPTRTVSLLESAFAITVGSGGTYLAVLRPWQEQIQWVGQLTLLGLSIISVSLGILVAVRALRKPPSP